MGYPQKKQQARSYDDIRRIQELEDRLQKASHYLKLVSELLALLCDDLNKCDLPF